MDDTSADWNPAVVVDSTGVAWVFWMGIDPAQGDFEIYYSRWTGSGWTFEERVHSDNVQKDAWPEASIGRDGIPWVVWERHRGGTSPYWDVFVARWTGTQWSEPETLFVGGTGEGQMYDVASVDTSLVWAVVSTYVKRGTAYDLDLFFRSREAGGWSAFEHIDHPVIYDLFPGIVISEAGVPWVVWRESNSTFVLHCSRLEETGWSELLPQVQGDGPKLCFSGGSGPWISYLDSTSNVSVLGWDGAGWSVYGPVALLPHAVESEWDYAPSIGGYGGAGPVVVWPRADRQNGRRGDVYISRWAGCWWSAEESVTEPDSELVAVDVWTDVWVGANGRVWVAWERVGGPSGGDYDIWARYSDDFLTEGWVRRFGVRVDSGAVVLTWDCPGRVGFNVYRSDAGACGGPEVVGLRELITPEPLSGVQSFVDRGVELGRRYRYWLEVVSAIGVCEGTGPVLVRTCEGGVRVGLVGVRPNPSGSGFMIGYYSGEEARGEIEVLDIAGRVVRRVKCVGIEGETPWDGRDSEGQAVTPGVYFVRFLLGGRALGRADKLVIVR